MVVVNGEGAPGEYSMKMRQPVIRSLDDRSQADIAAFAGRTVHAVAGIGNPQRFFDLLGRLGMRAEPHPFPDHHPFRAEDLLFDDGLPVLMTEKDAVRCRHLACRDCWVVQVTAQPDGGFVHRLNTAMKDIADGQKAAGHPGLPDL